MKKKLLIFFTSLIIIFGLFIIEEDIRLKNKSNAKPLIIFKIDENIDAENLDIREEMYYSLGFKLKKYYIVDEKSHDDLLILNVTGEEFYLFDKIMLWAWTA